MNNGQNFRVLLYYFYKELLCQHFWCKKCAYLDSVWLSSFCSCYITHGIVKTTKRCCDVDYSLSSISGCSSILNWSRYFLKVWVSSNPTKFQKFLFYTILNCSIIQEKIFFQLIFVFSNGEMKLFWIVFNVISERFHFYCTILWAVEQ